MTFFVYSLLLFIWILIIGVVCFLWPFVAPLFQKLWSILIPVLIAGLVAYLLHPFIEGLNQWGIPRLQAILIVFASAIGLITLAFVFGLPAFSKQIQSAMDVLPAQIDRIVSFLHSFEPTLNRMPAFLKDHMDEWSGNLQSFLEQSFDQLESILITLIRSIPSLVVIPFLVFYFLKDHALLKKVVWYVTPPKWRKRLSLYAKDVDHSFGSFIRGQLLVALIVALLSIIGLWLLGVPYAVLLGLFIGATDIIPYFGAIIGAVPALITAFLISWEKGLYTLIVLVVIQQLEGNVLSPIIVGRTLHLHPMMIVLALLIGVELGGIWGMLLAVPGLAVLKVTLLHVREYVQSN
ncbi:AI-2E family transporter [Alkalicoccobacillus porphyridii]|uniref:AI-2E family transporter n=2 Tax=Alkalicoccobacillus porphyridii TaxID=2597270 RepID=A0A553ZWI9_9BACI|nr:AI-2E family transporter [Alkalicoccobacillus porphyridii]